MSARHALIPQFQLVLVRTIPEAAKRIIPNCRLLPVSFYSRTMPGPVLRISDHPPENFQRDDQSSTNRPHIH